ncbi:hypothetical protein Pan189_40390 [Stratiformator vulcanicus]|uniref:Putative restriction endonuclease domain-containing protein n=2 Tax=Stratiformator vulcanicus TaxID=2527980 RepID=A0A517R6X3_9PLAN|nr:hypothetical protein Pan189_40390 [Stratiformator vulcanicus]
MTNDTGFILERGPDTVRGPDVAFVRKSRLESGVSLQTYFDFPPDLAVEVLSPSDRWSAVTDKVDQYLDAGTALVWVVDPEKCRVYVFRADDAFRTLGAGDSVESEEVLPGFSCRVSDFFLGIEEE